MLTHFSIQHILVGRALVGEHLRRPEQIIEGLEAVACGWNRNPTLFEWAVAGRCDRLTLESSVMLWEGAEPAREGRYEGVGVWWKNGDTRVE